MKFYKYNLIALFCCGFALTGCDKYLDISPKGKTLLNTVPDYDQWLNDEQLVWGAGNVSGLINFLSDNVDAPGITNPPTTAGELIYTWAPQFSTDVNVAPTFWGDHYSNINKFNTVLLGI